MDIITNLHITVRKKKPEFSYVHSKATLEEIVRLQFKTTAYLVVSQYKEGTTTSRLQNDSNKFRICCTVCRVDGIS